MRAVTWCGRHNVRVENVPDPGILNPRDAIIKVRLTAICGSDLHLYDGFVPAMKKGDILGHEFAGEVVEVGREVKNLKPGDRVVVPFTISCGRCWYCSTQQYSLCDNSNPKGWMTEKLFGQPMAGIYGYSHLMGGYAGGQAEYVRVPFADIGPLKVPDDLTDEQCLFLSDIFPTGYQAAEYGDIQRGDTVAVWGCGPVGLFAIRSCFLLGAERVIGIDRVPERLELARKCGAEAIDYSEQSVYDRIMFLTGGWGADVCIDAVGLEAHGTSPDALYDRVKTSLMLTTDQGHVLREIVHCCRKGGHVSIPGVYGGYVDKFPMGAAMNKSLTFRMGQTHVQKYMRPLLERIRRGEIDPTFVITHRLPLDQAPEAYRMFHDKRDQCIKVVLKP